MSILTGPKHAVRRKERQKKPDELLSSVVRETAVPAAVELLRGNERFGLPSGTAWVVLVLAAESIGGLSRRHGRDEARGSIIELIENDSIRTLATSDMLDQQIFGIIPTIGTLERMDEYGLLTTADYTWAVVYQPGGQGLQVDLAAPATFAQAQGVSQSRVDLRDAIGAEMWARHSGEANMDAGLTEAAADAELAEVAVEPNERSFDDGDPLFDQEPVFGTDPDDDLDFSTAFADDEDLDSPSFDEHGVPDELADGVIGPGNPVSGGEGLDQPTEQLPAAPVANQLQVRGSLARRFLSEDLDLQVTLDEFTTSFGVGALTVQIEAPQAATSWLGDQVAQLVRQANAQLSQLHADGQTTLQTQFVTLMSLHAEQVIREVSIDREGSVYQGLTAGARAEYREALAAREEKGRQAQAEIAEVFEAAIARVGQQAAAQAEAQYRERNSPRIRREQLDAVTAIEAKVENDYDYTRQEILGLRRKDAQRKMAIGMTRVFEVLAERQAEALAAERALLVRLTDEIQSVIDENRKNDISRAQALATEQATVNRIGELEREHAGAIARMRAEQEEQLRRAEEEFEHARHSTIEQLRARDEEWQHRLNLESEKTTSQTNRVSDLLLQMDHMSESFGKHYDARVNELQADRQAYINDLERSNLMQSRSNTALIAMAAVLALLMLAGGFVIGATLI
ncbi:hypothetical protein GCM10029976_067650 [Kribbella albertanoniae]|uniref:Uncharacterized protein n=1 Tax=Kribbella albertanoniae TaxID=1266829 RepID=A0A4R4QJ83_9ACTN|nr:hypothetical protein [Kribbella albertanoniae]TDC35866.1 hypothetical protein E1261_00640 [Kribbella albertanoniae]